jgi:hypothetical protein
MLKMETLRSDVKRDKRKIRCINSSISGFSSTTLRFGDYFLYREGQTGPLQFAKCHGRVCPIVQIDPKDKTGYMILALVISTNHIFSMERWVSPEDVEEVIPVERVSPHLEEMFHSLLEDLNSWTLETRRRC